MQQQRDAGSSPQGGNGSAPWASGASDEVVGAAIAAGGSASGARGGSDDREPAARELVDRNGVHWRVYELTRPTGPAGSTGRYLVFDSDAVVRRVSNYPAGWRDLPPAELLALSWGR